MKDRFDQELAIDDTVAVTMKNYRGLIIAKVKDFTPQKVRVAYRHGGYEETYLVEPTWVVKRPTIGVDMDDQT